MLSARLYIWIYLILSFFSFISSFNRCFGTVFYFLFYCGFIDFTIFCVYIWGTTVFNINKHSTHHPVNHCPSKVGIIVNIITGFVTLLFEEWNNYKSWNVVKLIIVLLGQLFILSHWYLSGNKIHQKYF